MIMDIKSIYFIKIFFSFIEEKNKLTLVKYNKNLQNKLDIRLINYKLFSQRYILYDKSGKGKEYDIYDKLIFEGEYKNGVRNGKGKEYYYNQLVFDGEYLNGFINGIGKQ